ncbi:MAG TPA: FGGY-family carbohydrate kinase [Anaerolineaceae bacterium]|nr:FGGY-family carbohydrate kinase [Anaerolineaceae bacterium]
MSGQNILTIDNGTQSTRAMIFDPNGNLLYKTKVDIDNYNVPEPGLLELDPEQFWITLCEACNQLWQMEGVDKSSISCVTITTQRSTLINLDRNGKPLRPAIVWLDQRRTEGLKPVGGVWGLLFLLSGMKETVAYLQAEAEGNWIQTHQPEIWAATHKYLLLSGYLTYRMTQKYVDSIGCQVAYIPFDYKNQNWSSSWDWKWQAVPMNKDLLPDLVEPSKILGYITKEASLDTGIPEGLPLIAAAADKACEVIGAGCIDPNIACLSYGTTATINTTHKKYTELIPLIPPYPSAVPGRYNVEMQIYRGYWMVSWFKREFGLNEQRLASQRGVQAEELFDDLINSVPPGSMGLILQPFWSPGLKKPGPEAKGAVIGFGDVHTRAHLYRAIIEGLAYALREGAERTHKRSGMAITELRIAGGGSQSDAAMQITADIFNLPTARPSIYEASGLGAAINAAVGMKYHSDFETAIKNMTKIGKTVEPDINNIEIYDNLYKKVYLPMYKRLKPLYEEIRSITGYPPKN